MEIQTETIKQATEVEQVSSEQPNSKPRVFVTSEGLRPLQYAGFRFFSEIFLPALQVAKAELGSFKYDKKKKNFTYVFVKLPDFRSTLKIMCDDQITVKTYSLDMLYYAPRVVGGAGPKDRDFAIWERMGTYSAFRSAQYYMKQEGYFLIEELDTYFGHGLKLYNCVPPYPAVKLWHNHNKIAGLISLPRENAVSEISEKHNNSSISEKPVDSSNQNKKNKSSRQSNEVRNPRSPKTKGTKVVKEAKLSFNDEDFPSLATSTVPKQETDSNVSAWNKKLSTIGEVNETLGPEGTIDEIEESVKTYDAVFPDDFVAEFTEDCSNDCENTKEVILNSYADVSDTTNE